MGIMLLVSCVITLVGFVALPGNGKNGLDFLLALAFTSNAVVALEIYLRTKDCDDRKKHHNIHIISLVVALVSYGLYSQIPMQDRWKESATFGFNTMLIGYVIMFVCLIRMGYKYLMDKLARNNNSTTNKYANWTENVDVSKTTKLAAIIACSCVVVVSILVSALGNTNSAKVNAFDEMLSKIPSIRSYSSSQRDAVDDILEELGLDEKSTSCAINKAFIEEYLKTHSIEEFFSNLNTVYKYMCGQYGDVDENSSFYKMKTIITTATEVANIEIMSVDFSNEGAPGFYTEHTEEYPPIKTWEVEGKFYNSSGQDIRYETKPCQCEYTYYGDFAVMHGTGCSYDEGRYEWQNGTFYDELPSWNTYDTYCLEYKGQAIICGDDFATSKFWSDAKSIKYFVVGDKTYFLYNSTEQNYGQVWSEFSK